ncbi:MAG: hypothetical protein AABW64_03310 [Nanoarchaeota archaeon]
MSTANGLSEQLSQEDIDESFIRNVLLSRQGFENYNKPLSYKIRPLSTKSFGLESDLAVIDVYNGDGKKKWGFVLKRQKEIPTTKELNERTADERYTIESKILTYLGDLQVIDADKGRRRIITPEWEGSLDYLLDSVRAHLNLAKATTGEIGSEVISARDRAFRYVREAMQSLVSVCTRLTDVREDFERSGVMLGKKSQHEAATILEKQLRVIVTSCLKDSDQRHQMEMQRALEERLQPTGDLAQELRTLAKSLTSKQTIIHYDPRTSNFLYKRTIGDKTTQTLPDPDHLKITLCDFESARLGPLGHDLAYFIHDPYLLFLLPHRTDRYHLYKEFVTSALPTLRSNDSDYTDANPLDSNFDALCRQTFHKDTIIALIERTANPLEIEAHNPALYAQYVGNRILEDNKEVLDRNLTWLHNHLNAPQKSFPSIRFIVRKLYDLHHKEHKDASAYH